MFRYLMTALVLVVSAAAAVFQLKYEVVRLERELAGLEAQLHSERWTLQTRRADWAYLTRPDRLALQAPQLGMQPARAERIVSVSQIGDRQQIELARNPVDVPLPSGAAVQLRLKPIQVFNLVGGGGAR
ncbi:MAG TPA: hypothetical protein VFG43_04325 [Geminicoccaceae bacterium]|nr:hypothetical protein [Geminicoccaceae bacterium]